MNSVETLKKVRIISEILKKRFGNLTVNEVLDISGEILGELEKAQNLSESRDKK